MYLEQFYLTCLAHASYMIGSDGEAAVVDPQRDVDIYLTAADTKSWRRARAQRSTSARGPTPIPACAADRRL